MFGMDWNFTNWDNSSFFNFTDWDENHTFIDDNKTYNFPATFPLRVTDYVGSTIFISFSFFALIANTIVLILLYKRGKMRSVFDITVGSLVTSNLLISIAFLANTALFLTILKSDTWSGSILRILAIFFDFSIFCFIVSLLHIILITFERMYALFRPIQYRQKVTKRHAKMYIAAIWMTSLAIIIINMFAFTNRKAETFDKVLGILTLASGAILCVLYGTIAIKVVHLKRQSTLKWRKERLVLINSLAVTVSFLACLLPFSISLIWYDTMQKYSYVLASFIAVKLLLDPVLYFYVSFWKSKREAKRRFRLLTAASFVNMTGTAMNMAAAGLSQIELQARNNNKESEKKISCDFATLSQNEEFRKFTKRMSTIYN